SEYSLNKSAYQAIRLNEGDEVISVAPYVSDESETVFFVTKQGMCLNAKMDEIPVQGRVAGGVKGIMLNSGDKVVFAAQISGEGEIVLATKNGLFKRVICCQIDPSARYRKGVKIASLDKTDEIVYADYVTMPYYVAVPDGNGGFVAYETEDISIESTAGKGRRPKGGSDKLKEVYSLKYND
ncbi:MAG: hypothetical protein J6Z36_02760, partial [Clostridia bacterium]|nr:hypothetical protein [Clostridia bacterium]